MFALCAVWGEKWWGTDGQTPRPTSYLFQIGGMRWAGHVARIGEERLVYRVLLGKPEGRRPLGRPRRRWVDLQEVGCGYMDWIGLVQDTDRWQTLVSVVMNLRVPWNAGNFLTSCKPVSFSRTTLHHGVSKEDLAYCTTIHVKNSCYARQSYLLFWLAAFLEPHYLYKCLTIVPFCGSMPPRSLLYRISE